MTELLERVITAVKKLPLDAHDTIATRLLNEVNDEQAWSVRFTATTDAQWDCLADRVRCSITDAEIEADNDHWDTLLATDEAQTLDIIKN